MKILDRGYWISKHYYYQSLVHYFIQAIRFRNIAYFSVCNAAIPFGGMLDDAKSDVYDLIGDRYLIKSFSVISGNELIELIDQNKLRFPIVLKPNIGFKGYGVHIIKNLNQLHRCIADIDFSKEWLAQEYIDYAHEYSILYRRLPDSEVGEISSFIEKEYPYVTGDGSSSIKQLLDKYNNPFIDKESLKSDLSADLNYIPLIGEKYILHRIGNYSRGSKFYSLQDQIDDMLTAAMDTFYQESKGLYFFRIDCKAQSLEALRQGKFKIMELNGLKSEPLHIYDPSSTIAGNFTIIKDHWRFIRGIVAQLKDNTKISLPKAKDSFRALKNIRSAVE